MTESERLDRAAALLERLPAPSSDSWPGLIGRASSRRRLRRTAGGVSVVLGVSASLAIVMIAEGQRAPVTRSRQIVGQSSACTGLSANVATQRPFPGSDRGYAFVFLAASAACRPGNNVELEIADGSGNWQTVPTSSYTGPRLPVLSTEPVQVGSPGAAQVWVSWKSGPSCGAEFALLVGTERVPITLPNACVDGLGLSPLLASQQQVGWTPPDSGYPAPSATATSSP